MTDRLRRLYELIPKCKVFADIGCDHGYIAKQVLDYNLADKVYASDVSALSLEKAEKLVGMAYEGRFYTFVSDGFERLPEDIDCAMIAGMGGEEICKILTSAKRLPETLILQPMKNADKLRRLVVSLFYGVEKDCTFISQGKYYDVIKARKSLPVPQYSEMQYKYGRDNLNLNDDFSSVMKKRIDTLKKALIGVKGEAEGATIAAEIREIEGVLNEDK